MFPAPEPSKSIVEPVAVKLPHFVQFPPTVCVYAPAVKFPVMFTFPAMLKIPVAVLVPAPLKVILLKLLAPILPTPEPLKSIVEPVEVKAPPLFVQLPPTVWVKEPATKVPVVILTFPVIESTPVAVWVLVGLKVILLKFDAPMFPLPLKAIVEAPWVNVPLLVQLPETVNV